MKKIIAKILICSMIASMLVLSEQSFSYKAYALEENGVTSGEDYIPEGTGDNVGEETASGAVGNNSEEETVPGGTADNTEETVPDETTDAIDKEYALDEATAARVEEARAALKEITSENTILALVYLSDEYPVRTEASYDGASVITVPSGQQVQIQDVFMNEKYEVWGYVTLQYQNVSYSGYIPRSNLAISDEVFLKWEEDYQMNLSSRIAARSNSFTEITQFPESYQEALMMLKQAHPNWIFVEMNTGLEWNDVVKAQMETSRSLIATSQSAAMQNGVYSSGWAYASKPAVEYYLDPRNGLTADGIFQFELLTYNASYHTEAGVQTILDNTFMRGTIQGDSRTYANAFYTIGSNLKVSPFHLAARVRQEQGVNGTSPLISGTYTGYEGYYNFFNVGASGSTDTDIYVNGLKRAKTEGWDTRYKSLDGGSRIVSTNYILRGQDTVYLQKFDVDKSYDGLYWHQYMQNIMAPTSEAKSIRSQYEKAGALESTFVFKIPVYNNMPSTAIVKPTTSLEISVTAPTGYSDTKVYLDGVEYTAVKRNSTFTVTAKDGNAKTAVMYKYDSSGVVTGMYVWTLSYNGSNYTVTAQPELEDLLTYHGFSIRITGKSGIRFKTGISTDLRAKLTSSGVNGYTLKEYGTLVMNQANRPQYPMILGGEKVASGLSYGKDSDGNMADIIYGTVSGRYHYTSVLVGLPANQYKTEFAFRGYMVLTKDGKDIIIYGPSVSRSIYNLSKQLLNSGQYAPGTSTEQFLQQLIKDGDNA